MYKNVTDHDKLRRLWIFGEYLKNLFEENLFEVLFWVFLQFKYIADFSVENLWWDFTIPFEWFGKFEEEFVQ